MGQSKRITRMLKILERLETLCQGGPPVEEIRELRRVLLLIAPRHLRPAQSDQSTAPETT